MQFRFIHEFNSHPAPICYSHSLLLLGSCFAEHIGNRLLDHKFRVLLNPNGILFNPISLLNNLRSGIDAKETPDNRLVFHQDLWHSFDHHGSFSNTNRDELRQSIKKSGEEFHQFLSQTHYLLITFGSAYVYEHKDDGQVVANCHKLPANHFHKRLLGVDEILESWIPILHRLKSEHPNLKIIWSVSPVKYLRDGAHGNNLSKSVLLLAVQELMQHFPHSYYFPAFELIQDELRDYRFYADDLAHPSPQAIQFVWEKFKAHCIQQEDLILLEKIAALHRSMEHRPLHPNTKTFEQFRLAQIKLIDDLSTKYPNLNWEQERKHFN